MWAGWREDPKMADMRGSPRGSRDRETDTEERGPRVRSCQDSRRLGQARGRRRQTGGPILGSEKASRDSQAGRTA